MWNYKKLIFKVLSASEFLQSLNGFVFVYSTV
jgi:hypothetical protein